MLVEVVFDTDEQSCGLYAWQVELPCASAVAGRANAIKIAPNNVMRLMRPFG
ncbi:MAG: hypothetical protein ACXVUE_09580 [Solirubrobacteraceae bacterium]